MATKRKLVMCMAGALAAGGLLLLPLAPLTAGTYHNSPIVCSDCHVMHANDDGTAYNSGNGYDNLLRGANTAALCLNCHADNGTLQAANPTAPRVSGDTGANGGGVVGTAAGSSATDNLAGGWFGDNTVFTNVTTPADNTTANGHDLEVTAVTNDHPPGDDATDGWRRNVARALTCSSCHDQHGNANYRNLLYAPNDSNLAEINSCTIVVTVANKGANYVGDSDVWMAADRTTHYDQDISSFCQSCHEQFGPAAAYGGATGQTNPGPYDNEGLVDNASGGVNSHHPIDMDLGATIGTLYNSVTGSETLPLLRTEAVWSSWNNQSVFCLTCHRAHGSDKDSGLRWDMSGDTNIADGSRGCQICHSK